MIPHITTQFTDDAVTREADPSVGIEPVMVNHNGRPYLLLQAGGLSVAALGDDPATGRLTVITWGGSTVADAPSIALAVPMSPDDADDFAQNLIRNAAAMRDAAASAATAALKRAAGK